MTRSLVGKVAIVTGAGQSKGIGRAAALKLAEQGASVVVTDVCRKRDDLVVEGLGLTIGDDFSALEQLVSELEVAGGKGMAVAMDVTDSAQIQACVEKVCDRFGGVDILFNNAGVAVGAGPFCDIPASSWDISWQVNVKGMVELSRAVIPRMVSRGGGSIINTSSLLGLGAIGGYAGYITTKFAVIGLTKALAAEFGSANIRCNAICPGNILTDMGEAEVNYIAHEHAISREEALAVYSEAAALGRPGQPTEIGDLVAFLAGPRSGFITGAAIPISGGMTAGL
jgi:NAD(P)-dependent dehydrogenase (short-subunit alcohol dehydrogenase family)